MVRLAKTLAMVVWTPLSGYDSVNCGSNQRADGWAALPGNAGLEDLVPDLASIDLAVLRWMNGYAQQYPVFDRAVALAANATFVKGGFLFTYLWWLWFRKAGERADNRGEVLRIFAGLVAALTIARTLQIFLPGRNRPIHEPSIGFVLPQGSDPHILEHWNSFPSDHAVIFFAIATAIWMRSRLWGGFAYLWVLLLACLTRVYLGYHYPSDVVAGAAVGTALMAAVYAVPPNAAARWAAGRIFSWEQLYPSAFYTLAFVATYQLVTLFDTVRSGSHAAGEFLDAILHAPAGGGGSKLVLLCLVGGAMFAAAIALAVGLRWLHARRLANPP
jgi:undecaprenyl-diphosphatase